MDASDAASLVGTRSHVFLPRTTISLVNANPHGLCGGLPSVVLMLGMVLHS